MRLWTLLFASLVIGCDGEKSEDTADTSDTDSGISELDGDGDGFTAEDGDCDDSDASVNPEADEVWYDGIDQNCDQLDDYDQDGDGAAQDADCDDTNADISPDAAEVCDGIDNDCDGEIDESGEFTAYLDADGDGFGTGEPLGVYCELPAGTASNDEDCNDTDATVSPVADEVCDEVDNDCDGGVDVGASDSVAVYSDTDGDGFGDAATEQLVCSAPEGTVPDATDCDDGDALSYPGATEVCDLEDNDCDGSVDEDAVTDRTYYADADSDGYGDAGVTAAACGAPAGFVESGEDCDDADPARSPAASEVCDSVDNDCDGEVDVDPVDGVTLYADTDGDGYGDDASMVAVCASVDGYVEVGGDCDDSSATANPAATEVCDGLDNDCDSVSDESDASDAPTWYVDADTDGYGDAAAAATSCEQPAGFVGTGDDCDDAVDTTNPGAAEVCDSVDNDCDGTVDDSAAGAGIWFADTDGDGFGDASASVDACDQPAGFVADATDCDDTDPGAFPGAAETCDGVDQDCDGTADNDPTDGLTFYADSDGDGFGDALSSVVACDAGAGYTLDASDCDDTADAVNPDSVEACNGIDDDCDGTVDPGTSSDASTWYTDGDGDGYGDTLSSVAACEAPAGAVADAGDCDDGNIAVNPSAAETCNGIDDDCDGTTDPADALGATLWYDDGDGDTFGDAAEGQTACDQPAGTVADATDCDDDDGSSYPGGAEICDDRDNDCDTTVDNDALDADTFYADTDDDGFGDAAVTASACSAPSGYVTTSTDCDDDDDTSYPGASETCDGRDNDCNTTVDDNATDAQMFYADTDDDGFGDAAVMESACSAPSGYVTTSTDCDDDDDTSYPGASETCDGRDNDCNTTVDDNATDAQMFYADTDDDGFGDAAVMESACSAPSGYVTDARDCDDDAPDAFPGNTEVCDLIDNDCDTAIDEAGAVGESTWYFDGDDDGFGLTSSAEDACDQPTGYVADGGDCDDADDTSYPGGSEAVDGVDNDCDGSIDEGLYGAGDLVITEVARQPRFGTTATVTAGAWFEVYNPTTSDIDISDWYITRYNATSGRDAFYIDPADGVVVPAESYAVFCKFDDYTAAVTSASELVCDYFWGDDTKATTSVGTYYDNTFNMQRDEDTLSIYVDGDTTTGTLVDEVHWTYSASAGYWPRDASRSMQLDKGFYDATLNDDLDNWCSATNNVFFQWYYVSATNREFGTPGIANHTCP